MLEDLFFLARATPKNIHQLGSVFRELWRRMVLDANGGPLGLFYTVHGRRLVSFSESAIAARVSARARARTRNGTVASQRVHAARSSHTTHDILSLGRHRLTHDT